MNYTKDNIIKAIKNNDDEKLNELLILNLNLLKDEDMSQIIVAAIKAGNMTNLDKVFIVQEKYKINMSCFQICYLIYMSIKSNNIIILNKIMDELYNNELYILDHDKHSLISSAITSKNIDILDLTIKKLCKYDINNLTDYDRYDLMLNTIENKKIKYHINI
jgi:hypothetical protein